MRINDNGVYRDMTPAEIKAMQEAQAKLPKPQPTEAQRIAQLEAKNEAVEAQSFYTAMMTDTLIKE